MTQEKPVKRSELYEEIQKRSIDEAHRASADTVRDLAITAVTCLAWALVGVACIAWSAHTSDLFSGRVAFFAGVGLGNGGVIFTLLAAYRRGERRGDW